MAKKKATRKKVSRGSLWKNRKQQYRKMTCLGSYGEDGGRVFTLTETTTGKKLVYESHEAAKSMGWTKQS